jgi:hypothetical protein
MLRTHRSLEAYCATLWWRSVLSLFPCNGAPVEWNWQRKTEVLGEKPVPVPLCLPQIPHGLTPGSNPGLRGERPATNRLSHDTANNDISTFISITCCFKTCVRCNSCDQQNIPDQRVSWLWFQLCNTFIIAPSHTIWKFFALVLNTINYTNLDLILCCFSFKFTTCINP